MIAGKNTSSALGSEISHSVDHCLMDSVELPTSVRHFHPDIRAGINRCVEFVVQKVVRFHDLPVHEVSEEYSIGEMFFGRCKCWSERC